MTAAAPAPEELAELSNAAAVAAMRAAWAEISRGYARFLETVLEVGNRAPRNYEAQDIGAALTFSTGRACDELSLASTLIEHVPAVFAALAAGSIDHHKARVFAKHLSQLTPEQADTVARRLLPHAPKLTTAQLTARLLREVHAIDPDHARRRYQDAVRNRRVYGYLDDTGTAVLSCRGLPVPDATAAAERLETLADRIHAAGYPATLVQARADLYLRLLDGSLEGLHADEIVTAMLALGPVHPTGPDEPSDAAPGAAAPPAGDGWKPAARCGVEVRVGLSTLLGLDENPAEIPGWGPIPACEARRLVEEQHRAEWRIAITDPEGYLAHGDLTRRRPTGNDATTGRTGGVVEIHLPATLIDQFADLATQHPRWARVLDGITRTWAHRHHARETLNRHPNRRFARAALRRHIHMRDRTCTFPGCRRPARRSDLDHTHDHGCGGTTTDRNSGPLCGIHHELKTRGIWRQQQTNPGRFTWTSPLGCTYRTRGDPITPDLPEPQPREDPIMQLPAFELDPPPKPPPLRPPPLPLPEDPPF